MESCKEGSTSHTGDVRDYVTTAWRNRHRSDFTYTEGRNGRVSLTNTGSDRTDAAGVVGKPQQPLLK